METNLSKSILCSSSLYGIDDFSIKFTDIFQQITRKKCDPLNHRKTDFDIDYEEFTKNISVVEIKMREFFFNTISEAPNIDEALRLVVR